MLVARVRSVHRVRPRVVRVAQTTARELGDTHVGTEHELLGLLADPNSDASRALNSLKITVVGARERILELVPPGERRLEGPIPFTPEAKKVLEFSLRESLSLGHRTITPGHVLLGLTRDPDGIAMQVLAGLGADQTAIRGAVMPTLPARVEAGPQIPRASRPQPEIISPDPVVRRLLAAAGGRALAHGRMEFGLSDFLASVTDDEDAANVLASLGVDGEAMREAMREAIDGDDTHKEPAG